MPLPCLCEEEISNHRVKGEKCHCTDDHCCEPGGWREETCAFRMKHEVSDTSVLAHRNGSLSL